MRRYRKGQTFRPPTAAESAAQADAVEAFRSRPAEPQSRLPRGMDMVKTPSGGIPARDGLTISSAICTRCVWTSGPGITKTILETDEKRPVYNLDTSAVPGGIYVVPDLALGGMLCIDRIGGTVRCCYAETHPGYGIVFEVYPGSWNAATHGWEYSTTKAKAIDWFYSDPEITPPAGATGPFIPRPSNEYGIIYDAVAGDCDSPGSCPRA